MTTMTQLRTIIDFWHEGAKAEAFDELMKLPLDDKVTDWSKCDSKFIKKGTRELQALGRVLINSPHGKFWLAADKERSAIVKYPTFTPKELSLFFQEFVDLIVCEGRPPF